MSPWTRFFLQRLPLSALFLALIAEALAAALGGVTLHRHNVDDLANAVLHDGRSYPVVLLGDSVTHNVAHKYRIGEPGEVADLTTHAFAGLPSSLFLLKRYLESGHRPRHVVIAASRGVFTYPMDKSMFEYYVGSVFTRPDEKAFLRSNYPGYVDYSWRPAALSVTTRIWEPLFSLLRRPGNDIWIAPETPAASPVLDEFRDSSIDEALFTSKVEESDVVRPEAQAIMREFCALSRQYGFTLHLVWAPMQARLWDALDQRGKLQEIDGQLQRLFAESGTEVTVDDAESRHRYPYFDRGLIHIRGLGWEQLYAVDLSAYVHGFEGTVTNAPSARQFESAEFSPAVRDPNHVN